MKSKVKGLSRIVFIILIVYAATFVGLLSIRFVLGTEYPLAVVEGNSMIPTYQDGDLLLLKGIPPENISIGTVIVFHSPSNWDRFIVHRVQEVVESNGQIYFVTKGDNNWAADVWKVSTLNVIGSIVFRFPSIAPLGHLLLALQSLTGRIVSIAIMIVIIAVDIYQENKTKHKNLNATMQSL